MAASGVTMMLKLAGVDPDAILAEVNEQVSKGVDFAHQARDHLREIHSLCLAVKMQSDLQSKQITLICEHLGLPLNSPLQIEHESTVQ